MPDSTDTETRRRTTALHISDFERLEDWARKVRRVLKLGFPLWLVGSALARSDYRDVDVRAILSDERFDAEWAGDLLRIRYLNAALSTWGQRETGLPIDFQLQRMTEAKVYEGARHPVGDRDWAIIPTSGVPFSQIDADAL